MIKQTLLASSATIFIILSPLAHADLLQGLRDIRNAVTDVSTGTKEVSSLKNDLGLAANTPTTNSDELGTGDVLSAKINKLKVFKDPDRDSSTVSELNKDNDIIFMGEEANGFYYVTTDEGIEGWVQTILVTKR